jgi:hypothetical protein
LGRIAILMPEEKEAWAQGEKRGVRRGNRRPFRENVGTRSTGRG